MRKKCKVCNLPCPSAEAVFCSRACFAYWRISQRPSFTCQQCGKAFWREPNYTQKLAPKYCSLECKYAAYRTQVSLSCTYCHAVYMVKPGDIKRGFRTTYCSTRCMGLANRTGETQICANCGTEFYQVPSWRGQTPTPCCSMKCSMDYRGPSSIEILVREWLIELGITFEPQFEFSYYFIDFCVPSAKLFIECDGDYWHSLPSSRKRDKAKDTTARNRGYRMLRLPEHLIRDDPEQVKDLIRQACA